MHQELPVAVGTGDRRVGPSQNRTTGGDECGVDLGADAFVDRRVGDDAAPAIDLLAAGFELWLHEEHHRRPRLAQSGQPRDHQLQRDERQVADDQVDRAADLVDVDVADVGALEVRDTRIGSESFVELTVPDVEGDDVRGTTLQQAIGEPAGGRAGIERPTTADVDAEDVECVVELRRSTADEPWGRPLDHDGVARGHLT
jgi:hypothetical protein